MTTTHVPVLLQETIAALEITSGADVIDATLGSGGHAEAILRVNAPDGRLLGLDVDPEALNRAAQRLKPFHDRVTLVRSSYDRLLTVAQGAGMTGVDAVLFDLGLSSDQLARRDRGFSFLGDGPLDMRFDPSQELTAADLVNNLTVEELANLIYRYGEERFSWRIARAIVAARPLRTTRELAETVARAVGKRRERLHPATRTFQALRIAVNDELTVLERALPQAVTLLRPGGRLVVISFHSLEDRIVKRFFRQEARDCICPPDVPACICDHRATLRIVTRKPVRPGPAEIISNPRSRSARLRVAERI